MSAQTPSLPSQTAEPFLVAILLRTALWPEMAGNPLAPSPGARRPLIQLGVTFSELYEKQS